jgi:2-polyprenyl-3-methyl-5-hydroxy-6-metoxy-1,4-benzoquinol methylase
VAGTWLATANRCSSNFCPACGVPCCHHSIIFRVQYHGAISARIKMKTETLQRCNICDSSALDVVDAECNVARCRVCGYVFDNPRPTIEELIAFYSRPSQYDSWLAQLQARDRIWKRRLSKMQATKKSGTLLDVGTGIGQFLSLAHGSYTEVYGTEVSSVALQIAKQRYNLNLLRGTIEDLDMRGRLFDNITLFHVLEHVPDPRSLLKICHSLLSSQGILVIAVPNEVVSLRNLIRKFLAASGLKRSRRVGQFGIPRISLDADSAEVHLSHFTPKVLLRLLNAAGFSVIESTLDPYYVATGMDRLKADLYYHFCDAFRYIFKFNIYDTMLMIARKVDSDSAASLDGRSMECAS